MLPNSLVSIRTTSIEDLDFMIEIERNPENQEYTTLKMPEIEEIKTFLGSNHDFFANNQIRHLIQYDGEKVGFVDLYDASFHDSLAFIAIIIKPQFRRRQIASKAFDLVFKYAKKFQIDTIYADVKSDNQKSLFFFEKIGFEKLSVKNMLIRMHIRI